MDELQWHAKKATRSQVQRNQTIDVANTSSPRSPVHSTAQNAPAAADDFNDAGIAIVPPAG